MTVQTDLHGHLWADDVDPDAVCVGCGVRYSDAAADEACPGGGQP